MKVEREQVLAFRLARHHLNERLAGGAVGEAAVVGLQDTPPDAAGLGLAARVNGASTGDLDALVIVPSIRGAPMAVVEHDLPVFTTALEPPDEAAAQALIGTATKALAYPPSRRSTG